MSKFFKFFSLSMVMVTIVVLNVSYRTIKTAAIEPVNDNPNFFIQLVGDSEMLHGFRTEMAYLVNNIVKEELEKLGLEKNYYFDFCESKPIQRLSLYYFYGIDMTTKDSLIAKIEEISKTMPQQEVTLKADVNFFGEWGNELVIMVEGKGLAKVNERLREMAASMNKEYKKPFYNVDKSEQFGFLPHTGIGMVRINRITDHVRKLAKTDDDACIQKTIALIKERVKKAIEERITKISPDKRIITFKTLGVFDPKVRKPQSAICSGYLKEYALKT